MILAWLALTVRLPQTSFGQPDLVRRIARCSYFEALALIPTSVLSPCQPSLLARMDSLHRPDFLTRPTPHHPRLLLRATCRIMSRTGPCLSDFRGAATRMLQQPFQARTFGALHRRCRCQRRCLSVLLRPGSHLRSTQRVTVGVILFYLCVVCTFWCFQKLAAVIRAQYCCCCLLIWVNGLSLFGYLGVGCIKDLLCPKLDCGYWAEQKGALGPGVLVKSNFLSSHLSLLTIMVFTSFWFGEF